MSDNKEFKATIVAKSSATNAFMVGSDVWYNLTKKQVEGKTAVFIVYGTLNKGDTVSGTFYEFKGKKYIDTLKLEVATPVKEDKPAETPKTEAPKAETPKSEIIKEDKPTDDGKPKCTDCGKALKDGKYTKCYECNQKNPIKKTWTKGRGSSYVESPEKQDQIARGNAVNALAQILQSSKTPQEFKEKIEMLYASVDKLSDYIRKGRE
jgi:hypothetical protein